MAFDYKKIIPILTITFVGFLVFFNTIDNSFIWDDEEQIVNNTVIHSLSNIPAIFSGGAFNSGGTGNLIGVYYRPLMTFTFSILYNLFGNNPSHFHLIGLIFGILNAILVYIFLGKFFDRNKSLLLSLLFLCHPLYSEVILYSANFQDLLFFFFGMLGLLISNVWSMPFFVLTLLSKETGVVFVLITIIYSYFYKRGQLTKVIVTASIAILIYTLLRFYIAGIYFTTHGIAPISLLSFWERVLHIPYILFYYFSNFIWPSNLSINQHWTI